MAIIYNPSTGFDLGDPDKIPLDALALPEPREIKAAAEGLILSASGWRGVFAFPGPGDSFAPWSLAKEAEDSLSSRISPSHAVAAAHMAHVFGQALLAREETPKVLLGLDSRPTGPALADIFARVLLGMGIEVRHCFIIAAPEIMAYAGICSSLPKDEEDHATGFAYISASHNPPGHNGVKFGIGSGGVLSSREIAPLIAALKAALAVPDSPSQALSLLKAAPPHKVAECYRGSSGWKRKALSAYTLFTHRVVTDEESLDRRNAVLDELEEGLVRNPLGIAAELNGSARTLSIDRDFFEGLGAKIHCVNDRPRQFVHRIVPEGESLDLCVRLLESLRAQDPAFQLGYSPDCDGDRGNLVMWDSGMGKARLLEAQEVFSLSCLAELACLARKPGGAMRTAVVVNDATSMRIERIASLLGARVFRAETGEANVVALAESLREQGWTVRILGEGSNGGTIVHPSKVRDPLSTLGAMIRLLRSPDRPGESSPSRIWFAALGREDEYREDLELADILATLPPWATTSVFEPRAALKVASQDKRALKERYAGIFMEEWKKRVEELNLRYSIVEWKAFATQGIAETEVGEDFGASGSGGLRIVMFGPGGQPKAFLWMRGSGTEPVFRIMADVAGGDSEDEAYFLSWHADMVGRADGA